jgi:putative CocE/NonD family hydrolase
MLASLALALAVAVAPPPLVSGPVDSDADVVKAIAAHYTKHEAMVPMRDGVRLHTTIYVPKPSAPGLTWPILMTRTPYGVAPYGVDNLPDASNHRRLTRFAPSPTLIKSGYIFVHQDVRGRMMSEGVFVDVRPLHQRPLANASLIDEATDAADTVDWLLKNVPRNNGRVGLWGISYPGMYAAHAGVSGHPAIKAISPQAPVTDWFDGDDFHHNGALFVADAFSFYANFGRAREKPSPTMKWDFEPDIEDVYDFFLAMGPLENANRRYFKGSIAFWNDLMAHETRDAFWRARDPRRHYTNIGPAVLVVGGFYDAEDLWGTLATYRGMNADASQRTSNKVHLAMGPWSHGGWARTDGDAMGMLRFGQKTSKHYQDTIEAPFFESHLKGDGSLVLPEATVFITGLNEWRQWPTFPPPATTKTMLYPTITGTLQTTPPSDGELRYVSDPAHPVPYMGGSQAEIDKTYMVADQRFASRRPDVLTFRGPVLDTDLVVVGSVSVDAVIATDGSDLDVVVKLIDVFPEDAEAPKDAPPGTVLAGAQILVRAEVMRGRYRQSLASPVAFTPGRFEHVRFTLPDVSHAFRRGHRLMVQVQSSLFPLVDRNPQTFVPIHTATEADFVAHTHTLRVGATGTTLTLQTLPTSP